MLMGFLKLFRLRLGNKSSSATASATPPGEILSDFNQHVTKKGSDECSYAGIYIILINLSLSLSVGVRQSFLNRPETPF